MHHRCGTFRNCCRPVELWCHSPGNLQQRRSAHQWQHATRGTAAPQLSVCVCGLAHSHCPLALQKERFYETQSRLAVPSSQELATFISRCLTYDSAARPSFRTILRELTDIQIKSVSFIMHKAFCDCVFVYLHF